MSCAYEELLEATIQYLEGLKSRGVRHVPVSAETLRALAFPAQRTTSRLVPAQTAAPPAPVAFARPASQAVFRPPAVSSAPAPGDTAIPRPPSPETRREASTAFAPGVPGGVPEAKPPLDPQAKAAAFAALCTRVLACVKCAHLASSRKTVVFGVGDPEARLMFVGEAPGADEDAQGEPFVGRAGELLTKIIQATGLQRGEVYIANILKCRPDTPGQPSGNRKPRPEEMATCIPFLHEQIDLIRPKVLVALGATAVEGLLGKTIGITKLRGHWQVYRGIPLMPTYHPAYLLRNQAMSEKRKVWEDMLAVMEKLELPISPRQRNFFLKG
jgi:DNA polymerase